MKSCTVYPPAPQSSTRVCYDCDWEHLPPNTTLYVNSSAIPHFRAARLPRIKVPFVLVSGDCDETVPYEIFTSEADCAAFLEDARLLAWFCQNSLLKHPKVQCIPIGMDYHTLSVNARHSWGPQQTPEQQERILTLLAKRAEGKPRQLKAYSNFHFSMNTKLAQDRRDCIAQVPQTLVFYEPKPCQRFESWLHQLDYAFVLSPHGGGLDCHRTWEALALGCYPIVRTSGIDGLFEGLPVLIVGSWSDVTEERLRQFVEEQKGKEGSPLPKLQLAYWTDKIRYAAAPGPGPVTPISAPVE
jgi:hypothetical protein